MIDPIRHIDVFSPASFGDKRIDVIGAGATGSRMALGLAKLGVTNIHVWDDDVVESHNVSNQAFGNNHIGSLKVKASEALIQEQTGTVISAHVGRVDGTEPLGPVVFLLVDDMDTRLAIWKAGLRYKRGVELVIETRVGKNSGRVYTVNPSIPRHVKGWEAAWYPNSKAELSSCGTTISVGPTAEIVSGLAEWQFVRWHNIQEQLRLGKVPEDEAENELIFSTQPMMLIASMF
jgi:molybdopterin/thiamine biosynthesis adenylyltransferase